MLCDRAPPAPRGGKRSRYCADSFAAPASSAAWASEQRADNKTPYWRTLKAGGELNPKFPGGVEAQRARLEAEGHIILQRGRTNIKYYVQDYEKALFSLK